MSNTIEYAKVFQTELDSQMVASSTSGWMELNSNLVKYNGGNEIRIPKIVMDGLADYNREDGFTKGAVSFSYETHALTQDRGRTFSLDAMDVDETNFVATAGTVLGEFQRTQVIPEVDAYRYSRIASLAIDGSRAVGGELINQATILREIMADVYKVYDLVGESVPLVISLNMELAPVLDSSTEITRQLNVIDFAQGNVTLKVKGIGDIPIVKVPSARMKTAYTFNDGTTTGQTVGGFVAAGSAKNINWIVSARNSVVAISKTDKPRIFTPELNQSADAYKIDYRKYHDLWIPTNKLDGVFVNIKEELA